MGNQQAGSVSKEELPESIVRREPGARVTSDEGKQGPSYFASSIADEAPVRPRRGVSEGGGVAGAFAEVSSDASDAPVRAVAVSPDLRVVAAAQPALLSIWDLSTGDRLRAWPTELGAGGVRHVAFTADGAHLLATCGQMVCRACSHLAGQEACMNVRANIHARMQCLAVLCMPCKDESVHCAALLV
jgi:hypothetical protein